MTNVLAISVPGTIEAAADEIAAKSSDAGTKRRALLWKIQVIPVFHQALFYSDALAAALDAWSLSLQFEQAVTTGAYRDHLGSLQPSAIETAHKVRVQIESALKSTAASEEGFERARAFVAKWAEEHPVTGPIFSRGSILPDLVRLAGAGLDVSAFQVMADIPATIADLSTRMDIYAGYLPKAARWQAELMAMDVADSPDVKRAFATLASVEKLTERANALLSGAGLDEALDAARREIRTERVAALASVDQQRVETLAYLTQERLAAVAELDRQRRVLFGQVDDLRHRMKSDLEELTDRTIRKIALAFALLLLLATGLALLVVRLAPRVRGTGLETPGPTSGPTVGSA